MVYSKRGFYWYFMTHGVRTTHAEIKFRARSPDVRHATQPHVDACFPLKTTIGLKHRPDAEITGMLVHRSALLLTSRVDESSSLPVWRLMMPRSERFSASCLALTPAGVSLDSLMLKIRDGSLMKFCIRFSVRTKCFDRISGEIASMRFSSIHLRRCRESVGLRLGNGYNQLQLVAS